VTLSRANYTDIIQLNITQRRRTSLRLIGKARRCRAAGVGSIPFGDVPCLTLRDLFLSGSGTLCPVRLMIKFNAVV
jgi:hypothetical protein